MVAEIIHPKTLSKWSVPQLLAILNESRRPFLAKVFSALYHRINSYLVATYGLRIPCRIPIRLPVPDSKLLLSIRQEFAKLLTNARLPSPLSAWRISCISLSHQQTPKVAACMCGSRPQVAHKLVGRQLHTRPARSFSKRGQEFGVLMCESPAALRHQISSLLLSASFPCKCSQ